MPNLDAAAHPLIVERSPWLRGRLAVAGDREISRLALICGAMARGESVVEGLRETPGVLAIADMLQLLGVRVDKRAGRWHVIGLGTGGFLEPEAELDFGNAAAALDLAIGVLGAYDFPSRLVGGDWLSSQSLRHLEAPLAALGASVLDGDLGGLPITLRGPRLAVPPIYEVAAVTPSLKGTMLLAGTSIRGTTEVSEPVATSDRVERLLLAFGAQVESFTSGNGRHTVSLDGLPALRAQRVVVPGDATLAAFAVVAALIVPGSEVVVESVAVTPRGSALLEALLQMGADIELQGQRGDVANLRVRHSELRGLVFPATSAVAAAPELGALMVAASLATGTTRLTGIGQLPPSVRHRLLALAQGLQVAGIAIGLDEDLTIEGTGTVAGGLRVAVGADPWAALAYLVLGMAATAPVELDDGTVLEQRFPGFIGGLEAIGASFTSPPDAASRMEISQ